MFFLYSLPVVAPILISQCYNFRSWFFAWLIVVAPILISQCYNPEK